MHAHAIGLHCFRGRYVLGNETRPPYLLTPPKSKYELRWPYLSDRCTQAKDWADWRWESPHCQTDGRTNISNITNTSYYDVCTHLSHRRVYYVGDSTQFDVFVSMCMLAGGPHNVLSTASWRDETFANLCHGSTTLTYTRTDFLNEKDEAAPPNMHGRPQIGMKTTFKWEALKGYDTIVINTGIHMLSDEVVAQRAEALARRFRAMPENVTIIWRSTVPGHDNCSESSQPLFSHYEPSVNGTYGWHHVARQNALVASVFERVANGRIRWLDANLLSNTRTDRHVRSRGEHERSNLYSMPQPTRLSATCGCGRSPARRYRCRMRMATR
jgi:hypothetical protein